MKARDIMTTNVVSLSPGNSIKHAAQIMLDCNVSGLPVLDDEHHLIGIISQGDLLRRKELGAGRFPASGRPVASSEDRAGAYVKRHSWKVGDVMTTTVVAVEEDMSIDQVAALLD
jgi:CBS domain-containing protein